MQRSACICGGIYRPAAVKALLSASPSELLKAYTAAPTYSQQNSQPSQPTCCICCSCCVFAGGCPGMGMLSATPAATTDGKMARSASAAACALGLPPAHRRRQRHNDMTQTIDNSRSESAVTCALGLPPLLCCAKLSCFVLKKQPAHGTTANTSCQNSRAVHDLAPDTMCLPPGG
jgi:hypothetical protein